MLSAGEQSRFCLLGLFCNLLLCSVFVVVSCEVKDVFYITTSRVDQQIYPDCVHRPKSNSVLLFDTDRHIQWRSVVFLPPLQINLIFFTKSIISTYSLKAQFSLYSLTGFNKGADSQCYCIFMCVALQTRIVFFFCQLKKVVAILPPTFHGPPGFMGPQLPSRYATG